MDRVHQLAVERNELYLAYLDAFSVVHQEMSRPSPRSEVVMESAFHLIDLTNKIQILAPDGVVESATKLTHVSRAYIEGVLNGIKAWESAEEKLEKGRQVNPFYRDLLQEMRMDIHAKSKIKPALISREITL